MTDDDDTARRLAELADRHRRSRKLSSAIEALDVELRQAEADLDKAEDVLRDESRDVARYQRRSLRALLAFLVGNLERRRHQERLEARQAERLRDERAARLAALRADGDALRAERAALGKPAVIRRQYAAVFAEREAELAASGPNAAAVLAATRRHADLVADLRELDEAIAAGEQARAAVGALVAKLGRAHGLGQWDVAMGGGGVTWMKHRRIDAAHDLARTASTRISRFQREVKHVYVTIPRVETVEMSDLLRMVDLGFDNVVTDLMVQRRISRAYDAAYAAGSQLNRALAALRVRRRQTAGQVAAAVAERHELVEG